MIFEIGREPSLDVGGTFTVAEAASCRNYDVVGFLGGDFDDRNGLANMQRQYAFNDLGEIIDFLQCRAPSSRFVIRERKERSVHHDNKFLLHDIDPAVDGKPINQVMNADIPKVVLAAALAQVQREAPMTTSLYDQRLMTLEIDDDNAAVAFRLNFPQYRKFDPADKMLDEGTT